MIYIFKKWAFHSRVINFAASGCLMAYLLHLQPVLIPYIKRFLVSEYLNFGYWLYITEVVAFSAGVFFVAVILDKVQVSLRERIVKCLSL